MTKITKVISWDMGHREPNHKSKCRNLHGHRYVLEVTLEGKINETEGISDEGMVIDFSDLKNVLKDWIDKDLDHGFMIYTKDPLLDLLENNDYFKDSKIIRVGFIPTAENMVYYLFENCIKLLVDEFSKQYDKDFRLYNLKLYETPNNWVELNVHDYQNRVNENM